MTLPAGLPQRLTIDEFAALPESDRYRLELSHGLLVREPRPSAPHGLVSANIYALLREQQLNGWGLAVIESGFELPLDSPTVRGPDVAFIMKEHLPQEPPQRWWPFAPDLAVEVVSSANSASDIRQKVLDYLEAGTRVVWVADPRTRSISVYRGMRDVALLTFRDELDGAPILPELRIAVADLFSYTPPQRP